MARAKGQKTERKSDVDAASEALLDAMSANSGSELATIDPDNPFFDADGDLRVVPTLEDLSTLVDDSVSVSALPAQEILRRNLKVTLRAVEIAELAYHANPKQGTSTALTQMQKMSQELLEAIESRQDPEALKDEILTKVVKPLVYEFIKVLTAEADHKRASLLAVVPPESSNVVQHAMTDLLSGVAAGMDEAFDQGSRTLSDLLGAKVKTKR